MYRSPTTCISDKTVVTHVMNIMSHFIAYYITVHIKGGKKFDMYIHSIGALEAVFVCYSECMCVGDLKKIFFVA